jgi:hypothetical protein
MEETPERPAWVLSEGEIVLVKIALGGDYAQSAFFDVLSGGAADLDTVRRTSVQINNALTACLSIEEDPKLQERAQMIVLLRARDLAVGNPVDYRMRALIAEWCRRQIKPAERGRPAGGTIKKIAAQGALLELAQTRQPKYGAKKQMYADLEARLGLKRSQLSEMLKGFDPWALIERTLFDKSD